MTYEEILWKISTSPFLVIGQIAFWVIIALFFMAGSKFFWTATKYLLWKVERARVLDEEHNAWVEEQQKRNDELLKGFDSKCYSTDEWEKVKAKRFFLNDEVKAEKSSNEESESVTEEEWDFNEVAVPRLDPEMPEGELPQPMSFVKMPKVDIEAEDPFHEFKEFSEDEYDEVFTAGSSEPIAKLPVVEEKRKYMTGWVRTYWDRKISEKETRGFGDLGERVVYPSQSEATEAAFQEAKAMDILGNEHKITVEYDVMTLLDTVLLEWFYDDFAKPETVAAEEAFQKSNDETYKNAIEKNE